MTTTKLPYYRQETGYTCGAAVARMMMNGLLAIDEPETFYAHLLNTTHHVGTRREAFTAISNIKPAHIEYRTGIGATIETVSQLLAEKYSVALLYMLHEPNEAPVGHWALLKKIDHDYITLQDPWMGPDYTLSLNEFLPRWHSDPALCDGVQDPAPWIAARKIT